MRSLVLVAAFGAVLGGCTTSLKKKYGGHATYRPELRGYAVSLDPHEKRADHILSLRHPLTGTKVQCRQELLGWKSVIERTRPMKEEDDAAIKNAMLVALPLTIPLAILITPVGLLKEAFEGESSRSLRQKAIKAREAGRDDEELMLLGAAVARGDESAQFRIGELLEKKGRKDEAILAYRLFLSCNVGPSGDYAKAEEQLAKLGAPYRTCDSTEPVELQWQE